MSWQKKFALVLYWVSALCLDDSRINEATGRFTETSGESPESHLYCLDSKPPKATDETLEWDVHVFHTLFFHSVRLGFGLHLLLYERCRNVQVLLACRHKVAARVHDNVCLG